MTSTVSLFAGCDSAPAPVTFDGDAGFGISKGSLTFGVFPPCSASIGAVDSSLGFFFAGVATASIPSLWVLGFFPSLEGFSGGPVFPPFWLAEAHRSKGLGWGVTFCCLSSSFLPLLPLGWGFNPDFREVLDLRMWFQGFGGWV